MLAGVSCSVTRKLPEGSYLVQKVTVEADKETPKKERIPASDFKKFIRQSPNKRFLGLNFYVWVYEQADPERITGGTGSSVVSARSRCCWI